MATNLGNLLFACGLGRVGEGEGVVVCLYDEEVGRGRVHRQFTRRVLEGRGHLVEDQCLL